MYPYEKIAKILRADRDYLLVVNTRLGEVTEKTGVLDKLMEQNERAAESRLRDLGISRRAPAREVFEALTRRIKEDDRLIAQALDNPACSNVADCRRIIDAARKATPEAEGFFLKREKAEEFLVAEPPKKVMRYLGYANAREMAAKEDLFEVFSALRFVEGAEWLNSVFFRQYANLKPWDFEKRKMQARALDEKWADAAETFVKKKWHNVSHLKELGVIFVIPRATGAPGEVLRTLSLVFHYLHEVPFYSDMFLQIAENSDTFSYHLAALLRGDVIDHPMPTSDRSVWLVVQRYLAKEDEYDWRLHVPHINPEALHWSRAENDLASFGRAVPELGDRLTFWQDLSWVGDFFKDDVGNDTLVSFDLVDTVMSLVMEKEKIKYLYHHEEALWNAIFAAHFGEKGLERHCKDHLLQGWFEV